MNKKILDWETLKQEIAKAKLQSKQVVFTNGCFDILHAGHIQYLYKAKQCGDILVIGVNTDKSVSSIKPGRPIVPESQRIVVLSALEMVDYVTLFSQSTPYELIKTIEPDILVKGGDWEIEKIIGRDLVKKVERIDYLNNISTTAIIKKIRSF